MRLPTTQCAMFHKTAT